MRVPQGRAVAVVVPWNKVVRVMQNAQFISVIVPVFNEGKVIAQNAEYFKYLASLVHELIFVDGGSTDSTINQLNANAFMLIKSIKGRAIQMNLGAQHASGDILLFLHVDTHICARAIQQLQVSHSFLWGFFRVRLDLENFCFRLLSCGINFRSLLFKVGTGDQCISVNKELFHLQGGFPEIALMEDIAFSRRFKKIAAPTIFCEPVVTSTRRWMKYGTFKTILLMWWLQLAYKCGVTPSTLEKWYR